MPLLSVYISDDDYAKFRKIAVSLGRLSASEETDPKKVQGVLEYMAEGVVEEAIIRSSA